MIMMPPPEIEDSRIARARTYYVDEINGELYAYIGT